jgi:proteasome lid subunit RPN8/RPN11
MSILMMDCAREAIEGHAERGFPNEVCGVLLGKVVDGQHTIRSTMPIDNEFEEGEQFHRFLITPRAMLKAEKLARYDRLDVVGIYHSHPNAEPVPSDYDRDHAAWTAWHYVIASVRDGKVTGLRDWRLRDDRSGFDAEEIVNEQ